MPVLFDARITRGITVFASVARSGSYAKAAAQIGLSRSGVGKAIARLEERTHMKLFDRTSRALKLTAQGRALYEEISSILADLEEIAGPTASGAKGRLRLATDPAFALLLMPALPALFELHPDLKVDVLVEPGLADQQPEDTDFTIRFVRDGDISTGERVIAKQRLVTCASREYVDRHGEPASPMQLDRGHACLALLDRQSGGPAEWAFTHQDGGEYTVTPEGAVSIDDPSLMVSAAVRHAGIVQSLDLFVEDHLRRGELVEILPEWNRRYQSACLRSRGGERTSSSIEAFTAFLESGALQGARRPVRPRLAPRSRTSLISADAPTAGG